MFYVQILHKLHIKHHIFTIEGFGLFVLNTVGNSFAFIPHRLISTDEYSFIYVFVVFKYLEST